MNSMSYDVHAVRAQFPALAEGAAHFDGPGGSQTPQVVADAVSDALTSAIANRGVITAAERRAEKIVHDAREAMADLLGGVADGIVFGRSMTALTFDLARTLAADQGWGAGDEVVVTTLDHDANIRPWVIAAQRSGATVRVADFDARTGELNADALVGLIGERTRLVAVTGASNLIGTRPDLPPIIAAAHQVGAQVHVDGVHLTAHALIDLAALGADYFSCSPYKFCGPHLGVLAAAPTTLELLHPDKLAPSPDRVPERFEFGTLPYELLAGVSAAVEFLGGLAGGVPDPEVLAALTDDRPAIIGAAADETRRQRLVTSLAALERHEESLLDRLERGLSEVDGLRLYSRAAHRTPTLLFEVDGISSADLSRGLARAGVNAPAGHFYAIEASRRLGLGDVGAVRTGLAPYTNADDVDRLVEAVREVTGAARS